MASRRRGAAALGLIVLAVLAAPSPARAEPYPVAVLQGLDKITARVSTIEAPVGETTSFGALRIVPRVCDKRPPEEPPESAAFLEIEAVEEGAPEPRDLFSGWMFASSPALSALEHPVYDVWVLDCRNASSSTADKSE